jgi:hypothetical protein
MARNRIIYQSQALYAGPTNDADNSGAKNKEMHRVQDISFNVDVARVDINEFGQLSQLSREITEPPTVSLDFSYYVHNGNNESNLGLVVNKVDSTPKTETTLKSCIADIIDTSKSVDELNYYVVTKPEGSDAHDDANAADDGVVAIGNGFMTSFSIEGAVGDYPTASVSTEASNILFDKYATATNPAIDGTGAKVDDSEVIVLPTSSNEIDSGEALDGITALRSGDITIEFFGDSTDERKLKMGGATIPSEDTDGSGEDTSIHIQNFSVEVPLARTPLNRIGSFFPFSREIDFPITGSFSISGNVADFAEGDLYDIVCGDDKKNALITFKNKCSTSLGDGDTEYQIVLKGATLDSQNFSHGIGDQQSVDLTFSVPLGANASSGDGIFLCGSSEGTEPAPTPSTSSSA